MIIPLFNQLRQLKNIFIITATIASRSAIQGGMTPDDAFKLSDNYILKCELLNDYCQINNLLHFMLIDFAKRVNQLHEGAPASKLVSDVSNYINRHMSETITVEAIAKEFFLSRSYLSKLFKAESNMSLSDFILTKKTDEAKYLLRYTSGIIGKSTIENSTKLIQTADTTPIALEISFDSRYSPGLHRNRINLSYELFRSSHNPNVYTAESRTITAALKRSNISSSISFSKLPIIRILYCNSIITDSHTFAINNTTIKAIITGNRFAPMQRCKSIFSSFKR